MGVIDWVFITVLAGVIWALVSQRDLITRLQSYSCNQSKRIDDLVEQNEALKQMASGMEEFIRSVKDPVERPLALAGFDPQEIYTLTLRLGYMNMPFAPVYTNLEKEHPELWAKYKRYLEEGGSPVEYLWKEHNKE